MAYKFQTAGNAISFLTVTIAAILYGNIGIKVLYSSVLRDVFHFPPLDSRIGKRLWVVLGKSIFHVPILKQEPPLTICSHSSGILDSRLGDSSSNPPDQLSRFIRWRSLYSTILLHLPALASGRI